MTFLTSSFFKKYLLPGIIFQSVLIAGGYGTGRDGATSFLRMLPLHLEKTKSGEPKTLYLNSVALDILEKRKDNVGNGKGAVFGYSYYTVRAAFKRACKRAGIEGVTLHTLRHTFGTRLIEKGADIVTTKDLLHYSSLEMTERYTHPDNKRNRDAVERLVQKGRGAVT